MKSTTKYSIICLLLLAGVQACKKDANNPEPETNTPTTSTPVTNPPVTNPVVKIPDGSYRCNVKKYSEHKYMFYYFDSSIGQPNYRWIVDSNTVWYTDTLKFQKIGNNAIKPLGKLSPEKQAVVLSPDHYAAQDASTHHTYGWDLFYYPNNETIYVKQTDYLGPANSQTSSVTEYFGVKM